MINRRIKKKKEKQGLEKGGDIVVTFFRIILLISLILTFIMIFADVDVRIKKLYIFLWALIAMIFTTSGVVM